MLLTLLIAAIMLLSSPVPSKTLFVAPDEEDVAGIWQGTLQTSGGQLTIIFHIERQPDGTLTGTLDSPDQGALGIPITAISASDDSVRIDLTNIGGYFEGVLKEEGKVLEGTWHQRGFSLPLVLAKTEQVQKKLRPQDPQQPVPYREEEVSIKQTNPEITLAGTLTMPEGNGPFPAVVLISGSGPQDRDESLMGHRPFLVLADYLTRNGIAVLRYDDRGTGKSTGNFSAAITEDFASDAAAGVDFLKDRPEIADHQIGLIGHSEGALVASITAAMRPELAFLVLLAGPSVTGEEILYEQGTLINRAMGTTEEVIQKNRSLQEQLFGMVKNEPDSTIARQNLTELLEQSFTEMNQTTEQNRSAFVETQLSALLSPWFRFFLTYDPLPALKKLSIPVLALYGEKDLQVPPAQNAEPMRTALEAGDSPDYSVVVLPGLNHLFQTANTGSPMEYASIEETFAPVALETIVDWIQKL